MQVATNMPMANKAESIVQITSVTSLVTVTYFFLMPLLSRQSIRIIDLSVSINYM